MSFQIISKDLSDPVRSHKDLDKDAAPYYKKAVKFYDSIAKQLVAQGHVLDLFASALDQVLMCHDYILLVGMMPKHWFCSSGINVWFLAMLDFSILSVSLLHFS